MTNEDLLYHYFSNSLAEENLAEFNRRLETDADFKAEFEFQNDLKQAIKSHNSSELKEKLKTFEAEITATEVKNTTTKFNWRIAASIIFFLGAGWFGYNAFFGVNYNDIYESSFQSYPNTEYAITRSDTVDSYERKAFVSYEAEDYENAISNFNRIPATEQKAYQDFYKAQSYLKLENFEKATPIFEKIILEHNQFTAESHWYLALIAIKQKDKIEATKQLNTLINDFDYNTTKAKQLLKDLH
ncbi:tetratricopeptide repeat protein [Lacinutrix chionoecetis]